MAFNVELKVDGWDQLSWVQKMIKKEGPEAAEVFKACGSLEDFGFSRVLTEYGSSTVRFIEEENGYPQAVACLIHAFFRKFEIKKKFIFFAYTVDETGDCDASGGAFFVSHDICEECSLIDWRQEWSVRFLHGHKREHVHLLTFDRYPSDGGHTQSFTVPCASLEVAQKEACRLINDFIVDIWDPENRNEVRRLLRLGDWAKTLAFYESMGEPAIGKHENEFKIIAIDYERKAKDFEVTADEAM